MPAIRKKTSKRGTTNKRARIKGKIVESRRKQKRDAKKNVQWKSKHKKDPGIPNNFPYKDQILAEVAEQRKQAAEEKQRKKDEKKAAKAGLIVEEGPDAEGDGEGDPVVLSGVGSVMGKATLQVKGNGKAVFEDVDVETEENMPPILINHDLPNLRSVLDQADVIIQVLDARDPLAFRSLHLEELAGTKPGRRMLFILNKIDTVPRESVASWLTYLRMQQPTLLFRASSAFLPSVAEPVVKSKGKAKPLANDAMGINSILAYLSQQAQEKGGDEPLAVVVVGLTNAGKSSFINSLLGKAVLPVYTLSSSSLAPTTTSLPQEVTLEAAGKQIRFIDTPGLSWSASPDASIDEYDSLRARHILLRNKGRIDRLKDSTFALAHIVSRADTEDLMLFYNLPAFSKDDTNAFLSCIARSNGLVKKAGALDLAGAARIVLRDWSVGKFPRFTSAPATLESSLQPIPTLAELYCKDEELLSMLKTRKETMKSTGLIKLVAGQAESRKVDLETGWGGAEHERDARIVEDDSEGGETGTENNDVEMDEIEDIEDEEIDEPVPVPTGKRKRATHKPPITPTRPTKKVSFAANPKDSKRARTTAGVMKKAEPVTLTSQPASSKIKSSKVANVRTGKATEKLTSSSKGEEAYDFGKFF